MSPSDTIKEAITELKQLKDKCAWYPSDLPSRVQMVIDTLQIVMNALDGSLWEENTSIESVIQQLRQELMSGG